MFLGCYHYRSSFGICAYLSADIQRAATNLGHISLAAKYVSASTPKGSRCSRVSAYRRFRFARMCLVPARKYSCHLLRSSTDRNSSPRDVLFRMESDRADVLAHLGNLPRCDLTAKQHRLPAINRRLSGFFHLGT